MAFLQLAPTVRYVRTILIRQSSIVNRQLIHLARFRTHIRLELQHNFLGRKPPRSGQAHPFATGFRQARLLRASRGEAPGQSRAALADQIFQPMGCQSQSGSRSGINANRGANRDRLAVEAFGKKAGAEGAIPRKNG